MPKSVPAHAPFTGGIPFDFGTHANDFLLRREDSQATETFVVRVPGGGAVPEHVHTDTEQTFVFLAGIGTATLRRDGCESRRYICRPGDVVFVPVGWRHSVAAPSAEGVVYVTVNAFLPGVERIGDSALSHAQTVQPAFADVQPAAAGGQTDPLATFRTAELMFRPDGASERMWPMDFTAMEVTLRRDPDTYRVRRLGPFEYVTSVRSCPRVLTVDLADALFAAVDVPLPVYVEGSQSPLSVKQPCDDSDLDLLVAVDTTEDLPLAYKALDALAAWMDRVPVPLSFGVVHADWLGLPNFYTAVSLDPTSPDRRWWHANDDERLVEADRRMRQRTRLLSDPHAVRGILTRSLELVGASPIDVDEWRLIPRWRGLV